MKIVTTVLFAATLSGCVAAKDAFHPKLITSNPRSVVVESVLGVEKALPIAEEACNKHKRFARFESKIQGRVQFVFDCVE